MTPHYCQLLASQQTAVAASLNRNLARIHEWCTHWCMILNLDKIKALVVSRSRTVSPPHGNLVLSGVSSRASPNLDEKFDSKLTFEDHVRSIVSRVSQRIVILRLVKRIFVDTSLLLRCYFEICWELFSGVGVSCWMSPSAFFSVERLCPDQRFFSLCHRRRVAGLSVLG